MPLPPDALEALAASRDPSLGPLVVKWPRPEDPDGAVCFATLAEWRAFVLALSLSRAVPAMAATKLERAQKLYLLAWLDSDLIEAGELVALTALELALTDCYAARESARRRDLVATRAEKEHRPIAKSEEWWIGYTSFADLPKFMVEHDGLTDDGLPIHRRCPALSIIRLLTGEARPSLTDLRNDLVHGAPSEGFPSAGVLEIARPHRHRLRAQAVNPGSRLSSLAQRGRGTARSAVEGACRAFFDHRGRHAHDAVGGSID
jgi:hypothetical protein